ISMWSGSPQDANNYKAMNSVGEIQKLLFEGKNDLAEALVNKNFVCVGAGSGQGNGARSEEHTSELQSRENIVCRLLLEKKKPSSGVSWSTRSGVASEATKTLQTSSFCARTPKSASALPKDDRSACSVPMWQTGTTCRAA